MVDREHLVSLVDWVQFTIPHPVELNAIYEMLGMSEDEFSDAPRGMHFYQKQKQCGHIRILYDGTYEMGIHVQMSGQGCREYETFYREGWPKLFDQVYAHNGKFSRLDLAVDEIRYDKDKPYFTVPMVIRKCKRNECRSKFKKAIRMETIHLGEGRSDGHTIYFGSDKSDIKFRLYEKNKERESKDVQVEKHVTTWNRFELQLNDKRADKAVVEILKGKPAGEVFLGALAHYIEMVDRQKDDINKSRWPRSAWWDLYLQNVAKLALAVCAPDRTIDEKRTWLFKQTARTFAQMFIASNYDEQFFVDFVEHGLDEMTEAQLQQAETYLMELCREKAILKQKKTALYDQAQEQRIEESRLNNALKAADSTENDLMEKLHKKVENMKKDSSANESSNDLQE